MHRVKIGISGIPLRSILMPWYLYDKYFDQQMHLPSGCSTIGIGLFYMKPVINIKYQMLVLCRSNPQQTFAFASKTIITPE